MSKQPSEAAKVRACELANSAGGEDIPPYRPEHCSLTRFPSLLALALFIDEVSEAITKALGDGVHPSISEPLAPLILPEPVDPLLIEARKMREEECGDCAAGDFLKYLHGGCYDDGEDVQKFVRAIRRGMELAQGVGRG